MTMEINEFVFTSTAIDEMVDFEMLKEASVSKHDFYQLLTDTITNTAYEKETVENYMYYWVYSDNPMNHWRAAIPPSYVNQMAKYIKTAIFILTIDNPNIIELLNRKDNFSLITLYRNHIKLSF